LLCMRWDRLFCRFYIGRDTSWQAEWLFMELVFS
jgi:hypothetical protein